MLTALAISGYRSLRDVRIALGPLNVVTGANGSGKSSLYRALRLLAEVAQGRVVQSLAAEGGMPSTLWGRAGDRVAGHGARRRPPSRGASRRKPVSLKLGFADEDYGYALDLGLPIPAASMFLRDPAIKAEAVWAGARLGRSNAFARREGSLARILSEGGRWRQAADALAPTDSMMTHCADPLGAPELLHLRERMRAWRFYDHLRVDRDAPARRPQVGTHTPVLAGDGADLAAALQTVREIGDARALDAAVDDAFPGSAVAVTDRDGLFDVEMRQPGLLRPLAPAELSEGDAALSPARGGAAVAPSAAPDGAERARGEPPPRPDPAAGAADRGGGGAFAGRGGEPRGGAGGRARRPARGAALHAGEAARRDGRGGRTGARVEMAGAIAVQGRVDPQHIRRPLTSLRSRTEKERNWGWTPAQAPHQPRAALLKGGGPSKTIVEAVAPVVRVSIPETRRAPEGGRPPAPITARATGLIPESDP